MARRPPVVDGGAGGGGGRIAEPDLGDEPAPEPDRAGEAAREGSRHRRVPGDGRDDAVDEVLGEALDGGATAGRGVDAADVAPDQARGRAPRGGQVAAGGRRHSDGGWGPRCYTAARQLCSRRFREVGESPTRSRHCMRGAGGTRAPMGAGHCVRPGACLAEVSRQRDFQREPRVVTREDSAVPRRSASQETDRREGRTTLRAGLPVLEVRRVETPKGGSRLSWLVALLAHRSSCDGSAFREPIVGHFVDHRGRRAPRGRRPRGAGSCGRGGAWSARGAATAHQARPTGDAQDVIRGQA